MGRNGQHVREKAEKPAKEAMRHHLEQPMAPRKGDTGQPQHHSRRRQAEPGGKDSGDTEQADRHSASRWGAGIAPQPLGPREAVVRTLCP